MNENNINDIKNKSNKGFVVIIVILIMIILGFVLFICYDKGIIFSSDAIDKDSIELSNSNQSDNEKDEKDSSNASEVDKVGCYGTYYGETSGILSNGLSYNYKYTYILNEDGTYTANLGNASSVSGVYVINDNTISFIRKKDTVGPRGEDPYYTTSDYVIAEDCSYIKIIDDTVSFNLNKQ